MEKDGKNKNVPTVSKGLEALRNIQEEIFDFEGWKISVLKSPILPTNCYCDYLNSTKSPQDNAENKKCQVCRFSEEIELKHLPEMVFPDNILRLVFGETEFVIEFSAFEAIKLVSLNSNNLSERVKVACSKEWNAAKNEIGIPGEILHSYDWTYSTDYKGSITLGSKGSIDETHQERIDIEKLKVQEQIVFYNELTLYEDELHDNGVSKLNIKIRVMPSGFFVLLRFFLRIDHVSAKINDTRIYFEKGNNYFLREYTSKEETFDNLKHLDPSLLLDPNTLNPHLQLITECYEKIIIK